VGRPRTPATAYNLLHHALGEIDGRAGAWGHVRGGMGAISMAIARSAQAAGATVRTGAPVASIDIEDGAVAGVTLADGTSLRAPVVVSGAHPATTVLELAGGEHFPDEVAIDMRRFRSRGGSVKVNMVLARPPAYAGVTDDEQHALLRTGLALCPPSTTSSAPGRTRCAARPRASPTSRSRCPRPSTRRSPTATAGS
jgi:phytoene dehydrogenase-like protein